MIVVNTNLIKPKKKKKMEGRVLSLLEFGNVERDFPTKLRYTTRLFIQRRPKRRQPEKKKKSTFIVCFLCILFAFVRTFLKNSSKITHYTSSRNSSISMDTTLLTLYFKLSYMIYFFHKNKSNNTAVIWSIRGLMMCDMMFCLCVSGPISLTSTLVLCLIRL